MPVYQALKTGICQSPKGEKNISNQYVLYLSFCEDIPFYTNDRSIMYYHDVLNDICYEIGSELSYMGKASGITDKLSILNGFKQSRPDEYQQLIEEIKEAFVPTFFKKDVPDEMSFVFSESFVDWLKYNSVHDFAAVGQALQDADRTITISPKDILNDYIIPKLKGNLHTISTLAQSLGVYTFVDVQVEDGPLMNVLREELPKLNYYKYNSGWIQYELGYLTHYGQGCDRDIEAAIKYYTAAYKDGNVLACNLLGWIFQQGDGVTVDLIQAVEWYSRGSQMGNADAMNNLAYMNLNGLGVEVDEQKAFEWYVKASEGGNLNSMIRLAESYFKGGPTPVDYSKAYEWANKAISIGNAPRIANAKYIVGYILLNGLAGKVDIAEAFLRLEEAAKGGVAEAWELCGDIVLQHKDKLRLGFSDPTPSEYYEKGHEAGIDTCSLKLVREKIKQGDYYYYHLISRLLDKNNAEAHYLVARLFYKNHGFSYPDVRKYLELPVKECHPEAIALLEQVNNEQAAHDEQIHQEQLKKEAEEARLKAEQEQREREMLLLEEEKRRLEEEKQAKEIQRRKEEEENNRKRIESQKQAWEINSCLIKGIDLFCGVKGVKDTYQGLKLLAQAAMFGFPIAKAYVGLSLAKTAPHNAFALIEQSLVPNSNNPYKLMLEYVPVITSNSGTRTRNELTYRLSTLARNGGVHEDCYAIMGLCFLNGIGVKRDLNKAIEYLEKAASLNSTCGLATLSNLYYLGTGVAKDSERARTLANKAKRLEPENENWKALAYYILGKIAIDGENEEYRKRVAYYGQSSASKPNYTCIGEDIFASAVRGYAPAMCDYADLRLYINESCGTSSGKAEAEEWYRKAIQFSEGEKPIISYANKCLRAIGGRSLTWEAPKPLYIYFDNNGIKGYGDVPEKTEINMSDKTDEPKKGFFSRIFGKK